MNSENRLKAQLVIITGLLVLFFVFKADPLLYTATALGIVFLLLPKAGMLIIKLWYKLAEILGWINSKVLLSITFYFVLFPLASIKRLFSKDQLNLKKRGSSLYEVRNHKYSAEDLENVW